jgi:hypothetical protein
MVWAITSRILCFIFLLSFNVGSGIQDEKMFASGLGIQDKTSRIRNTAFKDTGALKYRYLDGRFLLPRNCCVKLVRKLR